MLCLFLILVISVSQLHPEPLAATSSIYNIENIINVVNLQFCTIVEIGQGYCNLFIEFRSNPGCKELSRDSVAEVYLGTCSCATIRNWDLCSIPLRKARPYECSFEEGLASSESSSRVHRRLCDPTYMAISGNQPCDCSHSFAGRTLYPVDGFQTCYRAPMPKSICSTHSVCGVYRCAAKLVYGLGLVQCDPNCLGGQPFCEEKSDPSSVAPTVTSVWSDWTSVKKPMERSSLQIDEAICLEAGTQAPAFDCLGPGSYCCPKDVEDCSCIVTTTMAEMKVTRRIGAKESLGLAELKNIDFIRNRAVGNHEKRNESLEDFQHL